MELTEGKFYRDKRTGDVLRYAQDATVNGRRHHGFYSHAEPAPPGMVYMKPNDVALYLEPVKEPLFFGQFYRNRKTGEVVRWLSDSRQVGSWTDASLKILPLTYAILRASGVVSMLFKGVFLRDHEPTNEEWPNREHNPEYKFYYRIGSDVVARYGGKDADGHILHYLDGRTVHVTDGEFTHDWMPTATSGQFYRHTTGALARYGGQEPGWHLLRLIDGRTVRATPEEFAADWTPTDEAWTDDDLDDLD